MFICDGCKELKKELEIIRTQLARVRGMFQMLICTCGHKQHGHHDSFGYCERCECQEFKEQS